MVFLRIFIEAGNCVAPYMAQIDSGSFGVVGAVCLSFVCITVFQFGFRREYAVLVSVIWESIGDAPADTCLFNVRERIAFEMMFFMPEQTLLEFCKCFVFLAAFRRHIRAVFIEVFIAAPSPGTFGNGQHVRIQIVLVDDFLFRLYQAVVPDSQDHTCHIIAAFGMTVDIAHEQSAQIGKSIEMVQIMET